MVKLTKKQLAYYIESHHLYTGSYNSKNYYKYNSNEEINKLLKLTKDELLEFFYNGYFVENGNIIEKNGYEMR